MNPQLFIVIPAKDEASLIGGVIRDLQENGFHQIIVVDDGSRDETANIVRNTNCILVQHPINLGSGAATQTGIKAALRYNPDYIMTMDADGQHAAEDVKQLLEVMSTGEYDVVIGSRFLQKSGKVPTTRLWYNRIANWVTWIFTGLWVSDSQSGMKIITSDFAQKIEFHFNGFEFCTELFYILNRNKARFTEVPIQAIYTSETMMKGQSLRMGFRMFFRLILWKK